MKRITIIVAVLATLCCTGVANAAPLPREPGRGVCISTRYPHPQRCSRPAPQPGPRTTRY